MRASIDKKFKGKYNMQSNRLKGYNYSSEGAYFITICCKNRNCFFGIIDEGKMMLNELGENVEKSIKMIDKKHDFILLDEYIVMPNHVHFILFIENLVGTHAQPRRDTRQPRRDTPMACLYRRKQYPTTIRKIAQEIYFISNKSF